jgi:hypothetical protein
VRRRRTPERALSRVGQFGGFAEVIDGLGQQASLDVQSAQTNVVIGQFGLEAEAHGLHVGRTRLGLGLGGRRKISQASPQIELVADRAADGVGVIDIRLVAPAQRAIVRLLIVREISAQTHRGVEPGGGLAHERPGLVVARQGFSEGRIGPFDATLQGVEIFVAVEFPPATV